ncbi:regulator of microtubule dynamics protein 1-like [Cimex lectularius]|uniref:Regulator of microtubule dynamics protein 1 n=1 Tax=Cimex lectularius TaxID=79782 RepID=A0A8I6SCZ1_CIMLE|nr:regulator of microtubule dynamics protein 1-like [Cimex lectularius]
MQFFRRTVSSFAKYAFFRPTRAKNLVALPHRLLFSLDKYKTGAFLISLSWFRSSKEANKEDALRKTLLSTADALYKESKYREICTLLGDYKDGNDVEILWRLSRAQYNLSQEIATSPEEKKSLIFAAYEVISKSLALDKDHFANHKWMSILLDAKSTYEGIKTRITHLQTVKEHMLKASELNPNDATTLYMLGLWCYQITDMPWYQRKVASTIFTAPPVSSYEEALIYFSKAEEVEPRFYSQNLLMLGKTYLKLNKEDNARYYLNLACDYPISNDDDLLASKEACELLEKLNKK